MIPGSFSPPNIRKRLSFPAILSWTFLSLHVLAVLIFASSPAKRWYSKADTLYIDEPFDLKTDASFRAIPRSASNADLCITHEHYDHRDAQALQEGKKVESPRSMRCLNSLQSLGHLFTHREEEYH